MKCKSIELGYSKQKTLSVYSKCLIEFDILVGDASFEHPSPAV